MATTNYDAADLAGAGSINEDVMQQIFDISPVDVPYSNRSGVEDMNNPYTEWTLDALQAPDFGNAVGDGEDAGTDDSNSTARVGNHAQISDKVLRVSGRAREVNTIGRSDELAYQLIQRGKELRRDVEAIALGNQASIADVGDGVTVGKTGGVPAWMETNTSRGGGGADGGFSGGVVAIPTVGAARGLTETLIRNMIESCYVVGGEPGVIMTTPKMKRGFSEYLFTSSARVATQTTETGQGAGMSTAIGAIDVFVSDFGSLELVPNRFQLDYDGQATFGAADIVDVFILDFAYWALSYLRGYRTEPLAKIGDADNRQMLVDWTVCAKNEASSAVIADINQTTAVAA